jgi:hypothetical protein
MLLLVIKKLIVLPLADTNSDYSCAHMLLNENESEMMNCADLRLVVNFTHVGIPWRGYLID